MFLCNITLLIDGVLDKVQNKLKKGYKYFRNSDEPHWYVELALVHDKRCSFDHKNFNKITRHTHNMDKLMKY